MPEMRETHMGRSDSAALSRPLKNKFLPLPTDQSIETSFFHLLVRLSACRPLLLLLEASEIVVSALKVSSCPKVPGFPTLVSGTASPSACLPAGKSSNI